MPYLKCVDEEVAKYILEEIYEKGLWRPCKPQVLGKQSYQNRLLLAYFASGCKGARQEMRQMPKVQECSAPPNGETDDNSLPMAIRTMGN